MSAAGIPPDEQDWVRELEAAGVIEPTDVVDDNGNAAYRLIGFPPGEEGLRLGALFDQHVQGRDTSASRNDPIP
jgi:hypothetical protein